MLYSFLEEVIHTSFAISAAMSATSIVAKIHLTSVGFLQLCFNKKGAEHLNEIFLISLGGIFKGFFLLKLERVTKEQNHKSYYVHNQQDIKVFYSFLLQKFFFCHSVIKCSPTKKNKTAIIAAISPKSR